MHMVMGVCKVHTFIHSTSIDIGKYVGFGYQSSWGAAQYTANLVDKNVNERAKL